jgi:hypothetical protein
MALPQESGHTQSPDHLVQFYGDDDRLLTGNVTRYIGEGLERGEGVVIIATPEHREAFAWQLSDSHADALAALREGRLVFLDAAATMARFLVDGQPERHRFFEIIGGVIRDVRERTGRLELRAYGEMVGLLWQVGQAEAAVRLEDYWNQLLLSHRVMLYCGYPIDVFSAEFAPATLGPILCCHTQLVSANGGLERALDRAMDELLGADAPHIRARIDDDRRPAWASLPRAEAIVLWLRHHLTERADEIVRRARYYRASFLAA